ncbi:ITPK [Lepeophtheirus salmonis]|uniref:Kinase n=1 Tax=Lepeophtheirus salmonis TaxID=72036 RepID=A0A7R8CLV8_LEPSM|nr:ITPK [Lepeophtheirus salmonis]CAF2859340.1 ITPK [Lepeophtheirus salmonis]
MNDFDHSTLKASRRFRPKRHSSETHTPEISIYHYDGNSVTENLEKAVRKISRGSSPNMQPRVSPVLEFMNDLARGYEEYRASLKSIRPTTEYGEASSDDLSSEWDNSDVESNNRFSSFPKKSPFPHLPTPRHLTPQNSLPTFDEEKTRQILMNKEDSTTDEESSSESSRTTSFLKWKDRPSGWRKVRNVVQWTPFIQTYKKQEISMESQCYEKFLHDSLKDFVPEFRGMLTLADDEKFIQLQDCLSSFKSPSIMDCKIGVRTYLEEELAKAKEKPKLRKDIMKKMIAVDVQAPTEEEHKLKGVTKPRYMVWRETISSTATLGFRIEGVKKSDGTSKKDFKTTKTREQVAEAFLSFIGGSWETGMLYLERLKKIRQALDKSEFFKNHELIGSSLLFVHDDDKASIWMIDFGKTVQIPESLSIDHKSPWEVGNHEDGYLIGMDNLINIFERLFTHSNLPTTSSKSPNPVPLSSPEQQEDVVVECLQKSFSEFSIPTLSPSSSSNHSNC